VITGIAVREGWWIDALKVVTNKRAKAVHLGGGRLLAPPAAYVDVVPAQQRAFMARLTFCIGKPRVIGLEVHWGCYKVGSKCVPR
jgi:hypothetical protein